MALPGEQSVGCGGAKGTKAGMPIAQRERNGSEEISRALNPSLSQGTDSLCESLKIISVFLIWPFGSKQLTFMMMTRTCTVSVAVKDMIR